MAGSFCSEPDLCWSPAFCCGLDRTGTDRRKDGAVVGKETGLEGHSVPTTAFLLLHHALHTQHFLYLPLCILHAPLPALLFYYCLLSPTTFPPLLAHFCFILSSLLSIIDSLFVFSMCLRTSPCQFSCSDLPVVGHCYFLPVYIPLFCSVCCWLGGQDRRDSGGREGRVERKRTYTIQYLSQPIEPSHYFSLVHDSSIYITLLCSSVSHHLWIYSLLYVLPCMYFFFISTMSSL